jgi:hypothetical protein
LYSLGRGGTEEINIGKKTDPLSVALRNMAMKIINIFNNIGTYIDLGMPDV